MAMALKLQTYEQSFLTELNRQIDLPTEDIEMFFRTWRWKFGFRKDKATAIQLAYPFFLGNFQEGNWIFIQGGKYLTNWEDLNFDEKFLGLQASSHTSDMGAPIYLLYGNTI